MGNAGEAVEMPALIRVLVVDDHPVVREGLRAILALSSDVAVGGMARNRDEALAELGRERFDLVTLDLSLPGRDGFSLLAELKDRFPRLPVLVLTFHHERQLLVHALRHGASGYVTKDSAPDELLAAIRRIAGGGKYVTAALSESLIGELQTTEQAPHERLSEREFQIMCLIASGKSTRDVAENLRLAETTISTYRARILEKMGFACNAQIIRYAIENKLVC
jgi:two-component system, NarL family, invasion response regulator UvrY